MFLSTFLLQIEEQIKFNQHGLGQTLSITFNTVMMEDPFF